jgi:hypothetical protein
MIFTADDYSRAITDQLMDKPKKIWISSFNFSCGISDRGTVYSRSVTHQAMELVNQSTTESRVLIGGPSNIDEAWLRKLTLTAEFFNKIQWRWRPDLHLKCWIFLKTSGPTALFGGRNLGDSAWADASLFLSARNSRELQGYYDSLWSGAEKVKKSSFKLLT